MPNDSTPITQEDAVAGQAVYSRRTLRIYDLLVLGISNRFIWKCPSRLMTETYNKHVSNNHLDVGVGTGYFLDKCRFPTSRPRLVLCDMNANCLEATAQRVGRYRPLTLQSNILKPIEYDGDKFDSIGLNYVLHCLPGTIRTKAVVFDHLKSLLNRDGVIFGATLLSQGVHRGYLARKLMAFYNGKGIFTNEEDSLDALRDVLDSQFREWHVDVAGCGAIFWGKI